MSNFTALAPYNNDYPDLIICLSQDYANREVAARVAGEPIERFGCKVKSVLVQFHSGSFIQVSAEVKTLFASTSVTITDYVCPENSEITLKQEGDVKLTKAGISFGVLNWIVEMVNKSVAKSLNNLIYQVGQKRDKYSNRHVLELRNIRAEQGVLLIGFSVDVHQ